MKSSIIIAMAGLTLSSTGFAQDYDDWEDTTETTQEVAPTVREVIRGSYAKANVGAAAYLLDFAGYVSAGTSVSMGYGQDFIDEEDFSMAWEVNFTQGIHNGMHYSEQGRIGCQVAGGAAPCLQGDLRTYAVTVAVEASTYIRRRIGLGIRFGAGALVSPLLIHSDAYLTEVVAGEFGNQDPGYHSGVKPLALFGPTFEYYSKLSHFSVGVDADIFYALGFDLGVNATGYMKYTF